MIQRVRTNLIDSVAVTGDKIAVGAVTGNLIANNAISGNNIASLPEIFDDALLFGGM